MYPSLRFLFVRWTIRLYCRSFTAHPIVHLTGQNIPEGLSTSAQKALQSFNPYLTLFFPFQVSK